MFSEFTWGPYGSFPDFAPVQVYCNDSTNNEYVVYFLLKFRLSISWILPIGNVCDESVSMHRKPVITEGLGKTLNEQDSTSGAKNSEHVFNLSLQCSTSSLLHVLLYHETCLPHASLTLWLHCPSAAGKWLNLGERTGYFSFQDAVGQCLTVPLKYFNRLKIRDLRFSKCFNEN